MLLTHVSEAYLILLVLLRQKVKERQGPEYAQEQNKDEE